MAQLQPAKATEEKKILQPEEKSNILVLNSEEDNYSDENLSYEMNQQVAGPEAFASAAKNSKEPSNKEESIEDEYKEDEDLGGDDDYSDFVLDEDNISVDPK